MSEHIKASVNEITYINTEKAFCDGPEFSKHPRVFLTVKGTEKNEVVCPYCGHVFKKK